MTAGDGVTLHVHDHRQQRRPVGCATAVSFTDTWPTGFTRGTAARRLRERRRRPELHLLARHDRHGGSVTRTISYTVPASTTVSPQVNSVTVSSTHDRPDPGQQHRDRLEHGDRLGRPVRHQDRRQSSVTAGDGNTYTYTITVTNGGPSTATGVSACPTPGRPASRAARSRPRQGSCDDVGTSRLHLHHRHDRPGRLGHRDRDLHRPGQHRRRRPDEQRRRVEPDHRIPTRPSDRLGHDDRHRPRRPLDHQERHAEPGHRRHRPDLHDHGHQHEHGRDRHDRDRDHVSDSLPANTTFVSVTGHDGFVCTPTPARSAARWPASAWAPRRRSPTSSRSTRPSPARRCPTPRPSTTTGTSDPTRPTTPTPRPTRSTLGRPRGHQEPTPNDAGHRR